VAKIKFSSSIHIPVQAVYCYAGLAGGLCYTFLVLVGL